MVGLRTIRTGKRVVGILLGMMVFIEGIFAIYMAKPTWITGYGGITQSALVLAGAQLAIIGALTILVWAIYKDKKMEGTMGKVIPLVMLSASLLLIIEGIMVTFLSNDILIGATRGVSKKYVALIGVQLFVIGMTQLSLWIRREKEQTNWLFGWAALFFSIVLVAEGLFTACISGDIIIAGVGTIPKGTVFLLGLQLCLLSGVLYFIQLFKDDGFLTGRLSRKWMNHIIAILVLVIALESVVLAYFTEPMVLAYSDSQVEGFGKLFLSPIAAQLLAISLLVLSSWKLAEAKLDRKSLVEFLGMGAGIALAAEGAFVLAISGRMRVLNEIGGIRTGTVMAAGLVLLLIGMVVLFCWHFRNEGIMKRFAGKGRLDLFMMVMGLITGIAGVALSALSARVVIDEVGSIAARYIELAGIQLIILASVMVLMWVMRVDGVTYRMKRLSLMTALFLMLLIPPAILM